MDPGDFQTLSELFLNAVQKHSKADAFLVKSGGQYRGVSSREVLDQAAALSAALGRLGVARGDRLAILAENRLEWAVTDYASLGLGAIDVPIYPTLLEPDIEFILRDSGSKGVVVSTATQLRKVLNIRDRLPELKFILVMDRVALPAAGVQDWHGVLEAELRETPDAVDSFRRKALEAKPEDPATLLYTSGTTGEPKGVILTHANIASNIRACQQLFPLGVEDVGLSFLPLSHVFERMLDYFCFWRGVSIAYAESMEAMPRNLTEVRPTIMAVVPRVLEKVRDRVMDVVRQAPPIRQKMFRWACDLGRGYFPHRLEGRTPPSFLRLRYALADALICSKVRAALGGRVKYLISGAAPLSFDLAEFFHAMGLPVYEGYGLTETSPVVAVNFPGAVRLGTVGRAIPGVEVKLRDIDNNEGDETGREILVRGPNVTPGYFRDEQGTQEAFVDGWFCTGDLGTLDRDGYVRITGRKKNLFKTSGGKYVSPDKVENLFQAHPYVAQIMVVGEARRSVGALIVPNFARLEVYASRQGIGFENHEELVTNPAIRTFFGQQIEEVTRWLAPHEKIRQFALLSREFTIESGELTPTQKIRRRAVEQHYRDVVESIYSRSGTHPQTVAGH